MPLTAPCLDIYEQLKLDESPLGRLNVHRLARVILQCLIRTYVNGLDQSR
jgi:hypothetical protein